MSGPQTWVLLRGLARESGHWGDFPGRLADALGPGHRVLAPDLPGLGERHALASPASVTGMAQACRAILADRLREGPVRVVALSLGGMVALEWARIAPHELGGCALVNTSLRRVSPPWARLRPVHWLRLAWLLRPGLDPQRRESAVLQMTSAMPQRHGDVLARWTALALRHPVSAANVCRQLWAAASFKGPAQAPQVPLLVICSAADRLVSPACSHALARHWHVPLRQHPWAGHDLPLDDPDWLATALAHWAQLH